MSEPLVSPDRYERCVIVLHHANRHLFGLRRTAWYSAHVTQSSTRTAWTLDQTSPRWVTAWPGWLAARRLHPDRVQLACALAAGGWNAEADTPDRFWRLAPGADDRA